MALWRSGTAMETDPPGERPPRADGSTLSTQRLYSTHSQSLPGATLMARPSAQPAFYTLRLIVHLKATPARGQERGETMGGPRPDDRYFRRLNV